MTLLYYIVESTVDNYEKTNTIYIYIYIACFIMWIVLPVLQVLR